MKTMRTIHSGHSENDWYFIYEVGENNVLTAVSNHMPAIP